MSSRDTNSRVTRSGLRSTGSSLAPSVTSATSHSERSVPTSEAKHFTSHPAQLTRPARGNYYDGGQPRRTSSRPSSRAVTPVSSSFAASAEQQSPYSITSAPRPPAFGSISMSVPLRSASAHLCHHSAPQPQSVLPQIDYASFPLDTKTTFPGPQKQISFPSQLPLDPTPLPKLAYPPLRCPQFYSHSRPRPYQRPVPQSYLSLLNTWAQISYRQPFNDLQRPSAELVTLPSLAQQANGNHRTQKAVGEGVAETNRPDWSEEAPRGAQAVPSSAPAKGELTRLELL